MNDPTLGTQIGDYVLEAKLGRGGMGVVYLARDLALRREVALKVLAPELADDPTSRSRFQREIETAVSIEHPHVVPVYGAGFEDGYLYLVMRYVHGRDLRALLNDRGPLVEARAMRLVGQIASALGAVHERGLVHRDVKPQNVLLWNAGAPDEHTFLTDFGIAKAVDEVLGITRGGALGTREYMAPELLNGAAATPACDQYSLAVLAYELLTGDLPFSETDEIRDLPNPIAVLAPETPIAVRRAIEQALSPVPEERFPSVSAFVRAHDSSYEAFDQSQKITDTVEDRSSDSELVRSLTQQGLSDARIAEIADLERSEVVRLRRRAARRSIVGE